MRTREFLEAVRERLPALLPPPLRAFQWRQSFSLLQLYYWYPAVHYELWLQRRQERVEVGLHFEGEREHNLSWAAALADYMPLLQASLGHPLDLEEWTGWWTRLHYTIPYGPLGSAFAEECAGRLAALVAAVQPVLEEVRRQRGIGESRLTGPPRLRRRRAGRGPS